MKKRWDALTVGEIYVDHVFSGLKDWPEPGQEIFTREYLRELGGGAAITACALARLGRRCAVFGMIGTAESAWMKERLQSFGVDATGLRIAPAVRSGVTVSISVQDDRTFFSYAGANELLSEYLLSCGVVEQLKEAQHVHFAAPLQRNVAESILPVLRAAGCTVSLDVGWQPEWYRKPENLETCREIDFFLPNRQEAEFLTHRTDPEEVLLELERLGFTHGIVKLGSKGAAMRQEGMMLRVPPTPVTVVDTTGAGDAFDAGLIDAVLDRCNALETLRRACACGSLSTRAPGAMEGLPRREELEVICEQS